MGVTLRGYKLLKDLKRLMSFKYGFSDCLLITAEWYEHLYKNIVYLWEKIKCENYYFLYLTE